MSRQRLEDLTRIVAQSLARSNKVLLESPEAGIAYAVTELEMSVPYSSIEVSGNDIAIDTSLSDKTDATAQFVRFKISPTPQITTEAASGQKSRTHPLPSHAGQTLRDAVASLIDRGIAPDGIVVAFDPDSKKKAGTVIEQAVRFAKPGDAPSVHLKVSGTPSTALDASSEPE